KRHLSDNKKKHWHIDYLLLNKNSKIEKIYTKESGEKLECEIAKKIIESTVFERILYLSFASGVSIFHCILILEGIP
uniref:DUF123 domain-containing protein n=1 Tax=Methanobrevibacter smithii TaxID=2173 RepID=UPI00385017A6